MIEFKNVSFVYSGDSKENAIDDINFKIADGEVVLICGESGCGKTTITRLVNGLVPNYYDGSLKGVININGKNINEIPFYEIGELVGSVFQNPRTQFFNVDTTSELSFASENFGVSEEIIKERIEKTVESLNIKRLMDRSIFDLSGGEKQKIACASVVVGNPNIIVLDEPSSNLDTKCIDELKDIILKWKNEGKTVIIAEHRLYFLRDVADRIVYMKNGKIEKETSMKELKEIRCERLGELGLRTLYPEKLKISNNTRNRISGNIVDKKCKLKDFKFYQSKSIILDIQELSIQSNSIVAIIGLNGAGKSTFARCLCGLEKKNDGKIYFDGKSIDSKKRLNECYMVMQDVNHQLFTESVLDEILLSMPEHNEEKAFNILKNLDLLELKERHPLSLSGGQKQRVAIASAIASEKDIIIFDEPTSGLDFKHMNEVSNNLMNLKKLGKTLFVITHDLELIFKCCSDVLYFENGSIKDMYQLDSHGEEKLKSFFII